MKDGRNGYEAGKVKKMEENERMKIKNRKIWR